MKMVRGISGKFFRALAEANVNIRAIAQGSSERSISAVISQKRVNEAVAFAHTAFFNSKQRLDLVLIGCGGVGGFVAIASAGLIIYILTKLLGADRMKELMDLEDKIDLLIAKEYCEQMKEDDYIYTEDGEAILYDEDTQE